MSRKNQNIAIQVLKRELSIKNNEVVQNVIENLMVEHDATGSISETSASNLIGRRPKCPKLSCDTQFLDAWIIADREYEEKLKYLRQYIADCVAEAKKDFKE